MSGIGDVDDGHERGTYWAEMRVVKSISRWRNKYCKFDSVFFVEICFSCRFIRYNFELGFHLQI